MRKVFLVIICITLITFILGFKLSAESPSQLTEKTINSQNETLNEDYDIFSNIVTPLVIEIIGAFLGFISALAVSALFDKRKCKELKDSLNEELETIQKELDKYTQQSTEEYFYRYVTTAWDIHLSSGSLPFITNKSTYKQYFKIYSKIQYAKELEEKYVNGKLMVNTSNDVYINSYIETLNNARKREAEEINNLIKKFIKENTNAG